MKKQFIALMIIVMLIASVHLFAGITDTSSVTDTVATVTGEAQGTVVSLGLKNGGGVTFLLDGPKYSVANPGAPATASGSGTGLTYGFGSRLQYTLFGAGANATDYFQIDVALAETQPDENVTSPSNISGDLSVGISDLPTTALTSGDRTSGSIGMITSEGNTTASDAYSGVTFTGNISPGDGGLRMIQLTADEIDGTPDSFALIEQIDPTDTWTGTEIDNGAQLFYDLSRSDVIIKVVYTLKATSPDPS